MGKSNLYLSKAKEECRNSLDMNNDKIFSRFTKEQLTIILLFHLFEVVENIVSYLEQKESKNG